MGADFRRIANVHEAYCGYLTFRWATDKRAPTWNKQPLQQITALRRDPRYTQIRATRR
jgi:hypothetical protein